MGSRRYLSEVNDELPELGVAAGLRLEPARDGLRHRLQQQRAELRDREYHLFSSTTAASPLRFLSGSSPAADCSGALEVRRIRETSGGGGGLDSA